MEYRTLGRTGLRVSAVALGCEGFMHKRAEEVKADFDFAIRHGINFVDIYSSNPDLRANIGAAPSSPRRNPPTPSAPPSTRPSSAGNPARPRPFFSA